MNRFSHICSRRHLHVTVLIPPCDRVHTFDRFCTEASRYAECSSQLAESLAVREFQAGHKVSGTLRACEGVMHSGHCADSKGLQRGGASKEPPLRFSDLLWPWLRRLFLLNLKLDCRLFSASAAFHGPRLVSRVVMSRSALGEPDRSIVVRVPGEQEI
jgi:hypothetical protein